MSTDSDGPDVRQTLLSAAIAGAVALLVLILLTSAGVGSDAVQGVVAIVTGVLVAQAYEYTH